MSTVYFYEPARFIQEHLIATLLANLRKQKVEKVDVDTGDLDEQQSLAVENACTKSVSILSGFAGTGKTTTLKQIVKSFSKAGMTGVIACPTGKAAKRAKEVISSLDCDNLPEAMTTYRFLGFSTDPRHDFEYHWRKFAPYDYVIIDEYPMVDYFQASSVLQAIHPRHTRLILSGDPNQLPSVDIGNFGYDLEASKCIPTISLCKIYRQDADSGIVNNGQKILNGMLPVKTNDAGEQFSDWFFIPEVDPEKSNKRIIKLISETLPEKYGFDPLVDIQALSPGKRGACGSEELNKKLREILNPKSGSNSQEFAIDDKVINRRNNIQLDIVNGDVGKVLDVGKQGLTVKFNDQEIEMTSNDAVYLQHAYCYTVHLSQGSEMPCAITPVHRSHFLLLFRNLIYTANTRPRKLKIFIGDPAMFRTGINRTVLDKRTTRLCQLLQEKCFTSL